MKYTYIYAVALSFLSVNAMAQETYENTKIMQNDLNGTARYVGMGGAMESLGAVQWLPLRWVFVLKQITIHKTAIATHVSLSTR